MSDLDSILAAPSSDLTQRRSVWLQPRLLQQLRKLQMDQITAADEASIDATALSRFINGKQGLRIADVEALLAALELRVVAKDDNTVPVPLEEWEATRLLARKGLEK